MDEEQKQVEAVIVDIEIPFWSLIGFLIKLAFAAIPAAVIVFIGYALMAGVLGAIVMGHK